MTHACSYEVPASEQMYREVKQAIGDELPEGLVVHLVLQAESGLRHIEVWDSKEAFERFQVERVAPGASPGAERRWFQPDASRSHRRGAGARRRLDRLVTRGAGRAEELRRDPRGEQ